MAENTKEGACGHSSSLGSVLIIRQRGRGRRLLACRGSGVAFLHNGILMALIAHGLIGISLLWDKVLLRKPATQNLFSYVFWMGAMSIFGVILVFFGFHMPPLPIALLAFGSGAFQLVAIFFYYE